jgi:hypothetical protein
MTLAEVFDYKGDNRKLMQEHTRSISPIDGEAEDPRTMFSTLNRVISANLAKEKILKNP